MENIKEISKKIEEVTKFYKEVDERSKNSGNLVDRTYVHEAINAINYIGQIKKLMEREDENIFYHMLPELKKEIKKLKGLEKLTEINGLTKEELKKGSTNIYDLFSKEQEYYSQYFKEKNIKSNIHGKSKEINLNNAAINALISTHYGNAIKWAPENTQINTKTKNTFFGKIIIQIENEFLENKPQRKDIGQNKGIGTEFTQGLIEKLKGSIQYYDKAELSNIQNPIYGIKITIPLK